MDGRFQPRTRTSRPPSQRPPIETEGNVARLRFDLLSGPSRVPTRGWYHAEAIREDADRRSH